MRFRLGFTLLLVSLVVGPVLADSPSTVHHRLSVQLDVAGHRLQVTDRIAFGSELNPAPETSIRFVLHAGLEPSVATPGWSLTAAGPSQTDFLGINASSTTINAPAPLEGWFLERSTDAPAEVVLRYGGIIHHPLAQAGEEYQRSFSETPGIISPEGVFLSGTSFWVPTFGEHLITFDLEVGGLTPPWDVVSQGGRVRHETGHDSRVTAWSCPHPTEEIYLIAGPWHEYSATAGKVEVFAFLRSDDAGLAARYLDATKRYLKLYQSMLPAFPFESFALVENFWETGYGMPGFTLLGPQVIRFPWILTSSYPHELLHNWWGNSVYVDFDSGNWCEGLTAYMADHLFAEQKSEAATYRRATLKKFTDFVGSGEDFPLSAFSSRRSAASEAVGYGKSLMMYHMLRRKIGDQAFLKTMNEFYEKNRFQRAGFYDLADAASGVTGRDWTEFFHAWTERVGAPELGVEAHAEKSVEDGDETWTLSVRLRQLQEDDPFPISVPVAVTVEGQAEPIWLETGPCGRSCRMSILCPSRPLRLDIDPAFDIMRRLDPLEVPPALSTILGADQPLFVLPSEAPASEQEAWRELATAWAKPEAPKIVLDTEIQEIGTSSAWILGWSNRFSARVAGQLGEHPVEVNGKEISVAQRKIDRAQDSLVLVSRAEGNPEAALAWVTAGPESAIPGLARKLPHYSRYSYLAFRGEAPDNTLKGMWQPVRSPLVKNLTDDELVDLVLPSRTALAELPPVFDAEKLHQTVAVLAAPEMEGRGLGSEGLDRATAWLESQFKNLGLEPGGENGFRQTWMWTGGDPKREVTLTNLVALKPGSNPDLEDQPVLVLAHLDHLGTGWPDVREGNQGKVHPGADDNASGVAVMLELARTIASEPSRARPILFAAVTGEENKLIGSRHLVSNLLPDDRPFACLNLDTVGRLKDGKLFVLNTDTAREWRFIFMGVGYTTGAPIEVVSEPLDASDQMACIEQGIPAVQLFTGPATTYHTPEDTIETIDADGMATVTEATHETLAYLADRVESLTITIQRADEASSANQSQAAPRRVSLGTMPDFSFSGPGVRVQQVMPDSAAASAGILAGDVLLSIDGHDLEGLRDFSSQLKQHSAGDRVTIRISRNGAELDLTAVLKAR